MLEDFLTSLSAMASVKAKTVIARLIRWEIYVSKFDPVP